MAKTPILAIALALPIALLGCTPGQLASSPALTSEQQSQLADALKNGPKTKAEAKAVAAVDQALAQAHVSLPKDVVADLVQASNLGDKPFTPIPIGFSGGGGSGGGVTSTPPSGGAPRTIRTGPPMFDSDAVDGDLTITDVIDVDQSLSVACSSGANDAPGYITASLTGKVVTLKITGTGFARSVEDRGQGDDHGFRGESLRLGSSHRHGFRIAADHGNAGDNQGDNGNHFAYGRRNDGGENWHDDKHPDWDDSNAIIRAFTAPLIPGFLASTYMSRKPANRVFLENGTLALEPTPGSEFTDTTLTMSFDTKALVDFMLSGTHRLVITRGPHWVRVPILFGKPSIDRSLAPTFSSATVVDHTVGFHAEDTESDDSNSETTDEMRLVQITGTNLPVDFEKVYCKLNGSKVFYDASFIGSTQTVGYLFAPQSLLAPTGQNSLTIITPFGITFGGF